MPDEEKKLIVDDDWKAEAKREKERLSAQEDAGRPGLPAASFVELVNILVMQAMAALGLLTGPGGQRLPGDLGAAKHFIDLLEVLEVKTKNNLTEDEKNLLDQVMYDTRMAFVQVAGGAGAAGMPAAPPETPGQ